MDITKNKIWFMLMAYQVLAISEVKEISNDNIANCDLEKLIDNINNPSTAAIIDNPCQIIGKSSKHIIHSFMQAFFADHEFTRFMIMQKFEDHQVLCTIMQKIAFEMLKNTKISLQGDSVYNNILTNNNDLTFRSQSSLIKYIQKLDDVLHEECFSMPDFIFPVLLKTNNQYIFTCGRCNSTEFLGKTSLSAYCADIAMLQANKADLKRTEIVYKTIKFACLSCGNNNPENFVTIRTKYPPKFIISNDPVGAKLDISEHNASTLSNEIRDPLSYSAEVVLAPEIIELGSSKYELYAKVCFTRNADGTFMNSYTVAKKGQDWYYFDLEKLEIEKLAKSYLKMEQTQNNGDECNQCQSSRDLRVFSGGLYYYRIVNN